MKSWKTPTPDQVEKAISLLGHAEQYRYFFDRLENPNWIIPLREKGFFKKPPPLDKDETEGTIGFPIWPESRYLVRMSAHAPELVRDVALEIPETENVRVHEDIVEAALAMPPEFSAKFVSKAKDWIKSPYHLLLPLKLGELLSHLAKGEQKKAALNLARDLLEVLPDKQPPRQAKGEYSLPYFPEPRLHFDWMYYEQIFEKNVPDLVSVAGFDALLLLCNLLETAVRLSRNNDENDRPEDNSYIWRPAIEDHEQNWNHTDIKRILVSAVRDAGEQLINANLKNLPISVEELEKRRFYIFHRIALHFLRVFSEFSLPLVSERLTNRSLFDNINVQHEYVLLIQDCFQKLSTSNQNKIFVWIENGPKSEQAEQQEDKEKLLKIWQLEKLAPIKDYLPKKWRTCYSQLSEEFGEPNNPEFFITRTSWKKRTSPRSLDETDQMTVEEIVDFLKTWQKSKNSLRSSPEGLGRTLSSVVATKPEEFASHANEFLNVDPTYVRALFSVLSDATKESRKFPWPDVLDLSKWVIEQPRELPQRGSEYGDLDKGWVWTRKEIARLLHNGLSAGSNEIPIEYRNRVWEILKPLTDDPEPTLEYEAQYGGSNSDPATLAINTVRGEAMHALISYALWIRRYLDKQVEPGPRDENNFEVMPEVREVLEAHLDPDYEPTETIRSVYGQFFPWLVLLDPNWAKSNVERIFPDDPQMSSLRDAAWVAYITFCRLYDNAFELLKEEYNKALERIGSYPEQKRYLGSPDEKLAEHLVMLYLREKLSLYTPDSLLEKFYSKASEPLRGHVIDYLGRCLNEPTSIWDEASLQKAQVLWNHRVTIAKNTKQPKNLRNEYAQFGWWFISGKFDDKWSVEQLKVAIELGGQPELVYKVIDHLAILAPQMPIETTKSLMQIIESEKKGLIPLGRRESIKTILASALKSKNENARQKASDLINRLGKKGFIEYRTLLSNENRSVE